MTVLSSSAPRAAPNAGRRTRVLLGVLALLAALFAAQRLAPLLLPAAESDWEAGGPLAPGSTAGGRRGRADTDLVVAELRDPALLGAARIFATGRNPFRFGTPPPPPPPRPPSAEELALEARRRAEEEALRRQLEAQRLEELSRPRPPEFTWRFLGNFGPERRQVAVFSDGQNIYNALEGDVLDGRFIVARIGYESVDIKFVGFPDVPPRRLGVGG